MLTGNKNGRVGYLFNQTDMGNRWISQAELKANGTKEGIVQNTLLFQRMANSHRYNTIDKLKRGEEVTEDKGLIKDGILYFYQKLYKETESPSVDFTNLSTLNIDEMVELKTPFTKSEVLTAPKSCSPDKAPSPDGFTLTFLQKFWNFI